jgi:hypothetical protein
VLRKRSVVSKPTVPVSVVYATCIIEHVCWIIVQEVPIVLTAHMICYGMGVRDVNLAKRGSDSANVAVGICIVCVIKVCLLGSGFASQEHR